MPKGVYDRSWMRGENNPAKRPKVRAKISKALKGRKLLPHKTGCICCVCKTKRGEGKSTVGKSNGMYGRKGKSNPFHKSNLTKEQKKHHRLINLGENNPNWKGGKSFGVYGYEFNKELKLAVRIRDNFKCKICGKTEKENRRQLAIHHIDYNKENSNIENLVSLCNKCHNKTNSKRQKWIEYFLRDFKIEKENISWKELINECKEIAKFLKDKKISSLVPIIRGGVVPAVIISNILNIPIKNKIENEKDVIIDEIVDFGMVLRRYKRKYPKNLFICLHLNTKHFKQKTKPDFYVREVEKFIIYPWETK